MRLGCRMLGAALLLGGCFLGAIAEAAPLVAASFSAATMGTGDTSTLTITITNSGAAAFSGMALSDTYPANLSNATPSNVQTTCGGTLSGGAATGTTVGLAGGTLAAGASCTITVTVTASTAGSYTDSTGSVTTTSGGTGSSASATLVVLSRATLAKSFSPTTMLSGATSTLSLVLSNPNTTALSAVAFSDAFPTGLTVAASPAPTSSCGGTLTATGGSVGLTGGAIAGSASCMITVAVTATAANSYLNTAGGLSSGQYSGNGAASNSATLVVMAPPTISKSFSVNPVPSSTSTTLTVTISNPNPVALTGVAFSDTYPANLGNTALYSNNTCGGTVTGSVLTSNLLSLTGGSIAANSSCAVSITVASAIVGSYVNVTSAVSSTNGGSGATATATLVVGSNPVIGVGFSPTRVATGASSTLTFSLTNTSIITQTGVAFTDSLPSGLVVAATPALSDGCGGTVTGATAGSTSIALTNGTIGAGSVLTPTTCTISVAVQSPTAGSYANTTGALSSTQVGSVSASNTATLQVVKPASITKSFSPSPILLGTSSTLSLVISNSNAIALTGIAFSDAFPANLIVSSTPTVTNNCGGTLSGTAAGASSLSLAGGTVAAGATCTVSIQVTAAAMGSYSNTTSGIGANETSTGSVSNTAVLVVTAPDLRVSKTHGGSFVVGSNGAYAVTVSNAGGITTSGTITVTDTLPTGLTYVASGSGGTGWTCSNNGQVVTCTSTTSIAASAAAAVITINVAVASVAVPSVINGVTVAGGSEPAVNANNNTASDYTLINAAAQSSLSTDGRETGTAGTSVFYAHVFTAGYGGTVVFGNTDSSSPTVSGWSSTLFLDTNCNGVLDGSEGSTVLTGSVAIAAGGQVCLIDRVFIPAIAPYNAQDQTTVSATFTPSSSGLAAALSRTDLTQVGSSGGAGLTLNKTVRNVTTGETASANDSAASGQTLEYTISYSNNGASSLSTIVINDTTPPFTRFVSAQCVTPLPSSLTGCSVTTQPAANAQGGLVWTFNGPLQSSASGNVLFRVALQ